MNKIKYIIIGLFLLFIIIFFIYKYLPFNIKYAELIKKGNNIINELEIYYSLNNEYPNGYDIFKENHNLNEDDILIIEEIYSKSLINYNYNLMTTKPFYYRRGDNYILLYTFGFDPPELYYFSGTREWYFDNDFLKH